MTNPNSDRVQAHPFSPQGYGNLCNAADCGLAWSDPIHEPANWIGSVLNGGSHLTKPTARIKVNFAAPDNFPEMVRSMVTGNSRVVASSDDRTEAAYEEHVKEAEAAIQAAAKQNAEHARMTAESMAGVPETSEDAVRAQATAELGAWWMNRAREEVEAVVPKAVAYGSNSLMQLGRKMAQMKGREVSDEEALELGCWVYAVGKVERWTDSVMRGERCSDDTIYDLGIYVKMAQRIRDVGSWPGSSD